jgi:hypothetical protein
VEWSENVDDAMENALWVTLESLGGDDRRITLEGEKDLAAIIL